jgi:hypothetical protein
MDGCRISPRADSDLIYGSAFKIAFKQGVFFEVDPYRELEFALVECFLTKHPREVNLFGNPYVALCLAAGMLACCSNFRSTPIAHSDRTSLEQTQAVGRSLIIFPRQGQNEPLL